MFDLGYVKSLKDDDTWQDQGKGFDFVGSARFFDQVSESLQAVLASRPTVNADVLKTTGTERQLGTAPNLRVSRALVYSSVSGTGKTVAMLQQKSQLQHANGCKIHFAFLGFNCCLASRMVLVKLPQKRILARRLAASTTISINNPTEVTKAPLAEVYKGCKLPNASDSKQILVE